MRKPLRGGPSASDVQVDGPDLDLDRHREFLAFAARLNLAAVSSLVVLFAAVPRFGFGPLLALVPAMIVGLIFERLMPGTAAGVRYSVATHLGYFALLGIAIGQSGGPESALIASIAPACIVLYVRHPADRATKLAWMSFAVALGPLAVGDLSGVVREPLLILASASGLLLLTVAGSHLATTEIRNRGQAVIDPLTGLLNRRSLQRRVDELRQQGEVLGADVALSLILIDVDHFKRVNDTLGHAVGDGVLKDLAYELRKVLRQFDAVFRVGGEEFVVLLPAADGGAAGALAERLRREVADRTHGGTEITISLGVATSPMCSADLDALLERADVALYRAKDGGRNRVEMAS